MPTSRSLSSAKKRRSAASFAGGTGTAAGSVTPQSPGEAPVRSPPPPRADAEGPRKGRRLDAPAVRGHARADEELPRSERPPWYIPLHSLFLLPGRRVPARAAFVFQVSSTF